MSDFKLPDLPSDEELGITDEDREALEAEDDGPEMTDDELAALLGDTGPAAAAPPPPDEKPKARKKKAKRKQEKAEQKAESTAGDPPAEAEAAPREEDTPRRRVRGPLTLALLLIAAVVASSFTGLPRPTPANAPEDAFSSARAMTMLVEIARRAHPPGSPEHARVRAYLVERLTELGLEPEVQTTTSVIGSSAARRAATVRNVLARVPGTESTGAVLVTAHYDGREVSRAAGDDGSGLVAILEALRALRAGPPLRNDLIVLLTDGEELGLLGARAFVDQHPWMADVSFVLSFEMRGGAGPAYMFETGPDNGWALRALAAGSPRTWANSLAVEVYERMPNDSDFSPFKEAGVPGLNFAALGRPNIYHQEYDAPENVSEATLQQQGLNALGMMRHLGDADLSEPRSPDAVHFSLPGMGLVIYDPALVLPISGALLLFLAAAVVIAMRSGARPSGIAVGLGLAIVGTALSFGAGYWLEGWVGRFHPEIGSLHGATLHGSGWYVLALVAAAFAIATALHAVARRWFSAAELALGAAVPAALLAVVAGFLAPMAAMNLQWPALAYAVAVLAVGSGRPRRTVPWSTWTLTLLFAIPAFLFLIPLVEGLWLALTFALAPALAAASALVLYLALPALDSLRDPNAWWAPLTGAVAAAAFLGVGVLLSGPSEERPLFTTLIYTYDHESGEAVWITDEIEHQADSAGRAWVETRTGQTFAQVQPMRPFLRHPMPVPVAAADAGPVPLPRVVTLSDSATEGARRVQVGLRSAVAAEMVRFDFEEGGSTRLRAVNGYALGTPAPTRLEHWGEPDSLIVLGLEVMGGGEPDFEIVEHLLRPAELVGPSAFERPPDMAPDITKLSDRAMLRSTYGLAAAAAATRGGGG